jgi:hypothetical protein
VGLGFTRGLSLEADGTVIIVIVGMLLSPSYYCCECSTITIVVIKLGVTCGGWKCLSGVVVSYSVTVVVVSDFNGGWSF